MKVKGEEVAALLRKAIIGEARIALATCEWPWARVYAGDCEISIDGWKLIIFNDCMEADYVSRAVSPDGRIGDLSEWRDSGEEPIDLLTDTEVAALEDLLESL